MALQLVFIVPKFVDKCPKSPPSLDLAARKWSKIVLHISSKNVAIGTRFIVAVTVLKVEAFLLDMGKLTLANKKTIKHHKSDRLNIIDKSGIPSLIISTCN